MTRRLRLGHLYPEAMNLYGDRGNVVALAQRCAWRGIELVVAPISPGDRFDATAIDLIFGGGDQDQRQIRVAGELAANASALRDAIEDGLPALVVCGSYQLFGHRYIAAHGDVLDGIGIFDIETRHPGSRSVRCIGNVAVDWEGYPLVGFENHGGRTVLGLSAKPLGTVLAGYGNNGADGTEGCRFRNAFGTYLHGSLLPKNPKLADRLIALALDRSGQDAELAPIDDSLEEMARAVALDRAKRARRPAIAGSASATNRAYYASR